MAPVKKLETCSGVYAIRNKVTGECYMGSSVNIRKRWREHVFALRKGESPHPPLQAAWILYGEGNFELVVLEECDKDELLTRENVWLAKTPAYNTYFESSGKVKPVESREKMSASQKGKVFSEETRMKMSRAKVGNKNRLGGFSYVNKTT